MFKGHPKGLIIAFFTNMGERFGFYTMMAILVLFLQARYGLSANDAGNYYSWFYFAIYALALLGGILADWTKKYKRVILVGQIVMFAGYATVAVPGLPLWIVISGLFTIALGNGLFKGNLQAVVGQLYDDPKYSHLRDTAFLLFYMGINVGAFLAPFAATAIRDWWLHSNGFLHDGSLPALCHLFLDGKLSDNSQFADLISKVDITGKFSGNLTGFANAYLDAFAKGYNWAFGIAAGAMIISLVVYLIFYSKLPEKEKMVTVSTQSDEKSNNLFYTLISILTIGVTALIFHYLINDFMLGIAIGLFLGYVAWIFMASTKDEKPRIVSLTLVYAVVIFFWMAFHQNGLTLTFFARDYTLKEVGPFTNLFFNLFPILSVIGFIAGIVLLIGKKYSSTTKIIGGALTLVGGALIYYFISGFAASNPIAPEIFQSFNPLFIISLTLPVIAVFAFLNKRGLEPSTPRKIGWGMVLGGLAYLFLLIGSIHLVSPYELHSNTVTESMRVSPYWLINSYLILTIAELFLSPMGLSFTSKVAPPRFQGLMQGGWLLATAVGNKLLSVGSYFWDRIEIYMVWSIFLICCIVSAIFIFSIMKRLENSTK